ncbi:hypothetical protein M501DRAFT_1059893 [Patellaria atrata CBS 101060]|uniref:Uncharacterized protein n=1 Tax=Patellaria atrata CBS 101060 TaxID=1346257 RepID=A0A9P4VMB9_9PEZI|nr:hypothetical protein M501DRAFT_1059893 [Patellaria atrata CBS 101060]
MLTAPTTAHPRRDRPPTRAQIAALLSIAPSFASCTTAQIPAECRTAAQAVLPLIHGFATYAITFPAEQAAYIALMAFESGDFAFNTNQFPGIPGQGTRNMQSAASNLEYATELHAAKVDAARAVGPAKVLELVLGDDESFASAMWFEGSMEGWDAYLRDYVCVGAGADRALRDGYWVRAKKALGVS